MNPKITKINGISDVFRFSDGVFNENILVLIEVNGDVENPADKTGNRIIEQIFEEFRKKPEKNLDLLKKIVSHHKNDNAIISLTAAFITDSCLYLGNSGLSPVYIKRNGKYGRLLIKDEFSSGKITKEDKLLFLTETFSDQIGENYRDILDIDDTDMMMQTGLSYVNTKEDAKGSTAICLRFDKETDDKNIEMESKTEKKESIKFNKKAGIFLSNRIDALKSWLFTPDGFVYESESNLKYKKILLTIAGILVFLLVISIFFNLNNTRSVKNKEKLDKAMELVEHQYDEAVSLTELNPIRARSLLSDGKVMLMVLLKEFPKDSSEHKKVNEWLGKITETEVLAYKIYKLTTIPEFFDLALIKDGAQAQIMASYEDNIVFLDQNNRTVYILNTGNKKSGIIAGEDIVKDGRLVSIHGKNIYIYGTLGVTSIDFEGKNGKTVINSDEKWGDIGSIYAYGGNIYLLDRKNNAIWKYIATENGFLGRQNYLNPDVLVDLSKTKKMVIDGAVWISTNEEMLKFSKGLGDAFSYKGFSESLGDIISFSTNEENKEIYILDKSTARIVVFDKDGTYKAQYQWDGLKNASDIYASENDKKIYVLTGSKIYAVDIK